jgi:hypothetical protein
LARCSVENGSWKTICARSRTWRSAHRRVGDVAAVERDPSVGVICAIARAIVDFGARLPTIPSDARPRQGERHVLDRRQRARLAPVADLEALDGQWFTPPSIPPAAAKTRRVRRRRCRRAP